jgi:hypothetical protein
MKLNLEIELDWIDEEKGIDEVVKEQIIEGVVSKIQKAVNGKIEEKVNKIIDEEIVKTINQKTDELFRDFINRPVTLSDNYGSKIKVYENMEQLIKERFDSFLTQQVDDQGRTHTGYGAKFQRLEYIIDKQLKGFADKFTKDAVDTVSKEIKQHIKDGLTTKLGVELMNVLKVNEMLQLPNVGK